MTLDINVGVIADLYEGDSDSVSEQALWSSLRKRCHNKGADNGLLYLQKILTCQLISTTVENTYTRNKLRLYQNITGFDAKYNVESEARMGFMQNALMQSSKLALTKKACLDVVEKEVVIPSDAKQVMAEFQEVGEDTFFIVRWHHFHHGIWVEADFIQVMVNTNTGKVFGYQEHWHDINLSLSDR
ncbi:MAG: hypothetical protein KUG82_02875 [Pseudomonadales bacterium]|nr:hypothetical protein [Pseudomonadales bacterium]